MLDDVSVSTGVIHQTLTYHPKENIIGDIHTRVHTSSQVNRTLWCFNNQVLPLQIWFFIKCFISQIIKKLIDLPRDKKRINTKWVFKCKRDENGIIVRNKDRLVVLEFTQREGINYNLVYAPVARHAAIQIFLAFALWNGFKVYQWDVKSAFLN